MPITSSTYQADPPDTLGRMAIIERHVDHTGREHMVAYVCDAGLDPEEIMAARASRIGGDVDQREAEAIAAAGGSIISAWTKKEFWLRVTAAEYAACKALIATDHDADYYWQVLQASQDVVPGDPVLMAGLQYFESRGCLASGRALEIGNG